MTKKILIIEDEKVLLEALEKKLSQEGYEIFTARDGEEGLERIKEIKPDLVLLDIIMPKMGGFEVMGNLQKDPQLSSIPVIVISNSGQPVELDRALALGAKDYLIKAVFDPEEVIAKVERVFSISSVGKDVSQGKKKGNPFPQGNPTLGEEGALGEGKSILIIEDDRYLRELIVKKLKTVGFETIEAIDGKVGLERIEERKPDLIILDIVLPGIDGFEVLKRLKEDPKIKEIPVILLSNLGQKADVERGLRLGANDYLIKAHFTPEEIISKVRALVK